VVVQLHASSFADDYVDGARVFGLVEYTIGSRACMIFGGSWFEDSKTRPSIGMLKGDFVVHD
jgi:hypothetical protein